MNKREQLALFESFKKKQLKVISLNQNDSTNEDVLSNFKTAGANAGISTEQQVLSLIAAKVSKLGNLFNGKQPLHESIEDYILDLSNYSFLLMCVVNDENINHLMESEPLSLSEIIKLYNNEGNFKNNCY